MLPNKTKDYKIYQSILANVPKTTVKVSGPDIVIVAPKKQLQDIATKINREYIEKLIEVQSIN